MVQKDATSVIPSVFFSVFVYLCRHDSLPFSYEVALGAVAVPEAAVPFVPFEPGDHAVVPATRTLGPPGRSSRQVTTVNVD